MFKPVNVLSEAIRFNTKEREYILANSNAFKVGLEFEFEVDKGIDYIEVLDRKTNSQAQFESKTYRIVGFLASANSRLVKKNYNGGGSMTSFLMDEVSDMMLSMNIDDVDYFTQSVIPDVVDLADMVMEVRDASISYTKHDGSGSLTPYGLWTQESPAFIQAMSAITRASSVYSLTPEEARPLMRSVVVFLSAVDDYVKPLKKYASMSVIDYSKILYNATSESYLKANPSERNREVEESKVEFVKRTHPLPAPWVFDVVFDTTVQNGAELITQPLSIKQVEESLKLMSSYIKSVGRTSKATGLHVNISMGKNKFNPIKAVTLLDIEFFQGLTGNSHVWPKYEPRYMVDAITSILTDNLNKFALAYIGSGSDGLVDVYEKTMRDSLVKRFAVNLSGLLRNADVKTQRVEFRFFGGKDYEYRSDEIYNDILNTMYAIAVSTDDKISNREYLTNIIRLLNRAAAGSGTTDQSFSDTIKRLRSMRD